MVRRDEGFFELLTQADVGRRVLRVRGLDHDWYAPDPDCVIKSVNARGTRAMVGRTTIAREAYSMHYRDLRLWQMKTARLTP